MIYQPKDLDALKADFIAHFKAAEQLRITAEKNAEKAQVVQHLSSVISNFQSGRDRCVNTLKRGV
jgi:hypothetical protein